MQLFCRKMPVALPEKKLRQSQTLTRWAQTGGANALVYVQGFKRT